MQIYNQGIRWTGYAWMGGLVQPSSTTGVHRLYTSGWSWGKLQRYCLEVGSISWLVALGIQTKTLSMH